MRKFKRALIIPIMLAICMFVPAVDSSAVSLLPTANFNGYFQTTPGELSFFSTAISKIDYVDSDNPFGEDSTRNNLSGVESLIGAEVILSGALRTDDYTFADAVLEIQDVTHAHTYVSAASIVRRLGAAPVIAHDPDFARSLLYTFRNPMTTTGAGSSCFGKT